MNITRSLSALIVGSILLVIGAADAQARRTGQVAPPPPPAPIVDPVVSPN